MMLNSRMRASLFLRATRRFCDKAAKPKDPPAPPPPPPPKEGGSTFPLVALAVAGGAAYYFQDEIKGQLGMKVDSVEDTGLGIHALKHEVEALGARLEAHDALEKARQATELRVQAQEQAEKTPEKQSTAAGNVTRSKPEVAQKPGKVDYNAVKEVIAGMLEEPSYDDGSVGPLFVRLAWHSAGTFDKTSGFGGTEGACMRFTQNESQWGANAGLGEARARLEKVKQMFPEITYSDLWSLAGTVALEEMGGPTFKWRPGRKDFAASMDTLPDGLLPDADGRGKNPADHLRDIFYRMGFNDREIVCLSGAHSLGRCHTDRSGFWGPWTRSPTTLSNEYYRLLLEETWSKKTSHEGKPWKGPLQFENAQTGSDLMMLETDMSLVKDPEFKKYVQMYAQDEDLFMRDFADAWIKLQELGVRRFHGTRRYWLFGPRE